MMKKTFAIIALILSLSGFLPTHLYAENGKLDYSGLVQCDGVVDPNETGRQTKCNFASLVKMIKHLIDWAFMLTIPIFTGLLAYAGFLHMTPKEGNRTKAKSILWAALEGFVIMLSAWLIVTTVVKWVIDPKFLDTANSFLNVSK